MTYTDGGTEMLDRQVKQIIDNAFRILIGMHGACCVLFAMMAGRLMRWLDKQ